MRPPAVPAPMAVEAQSKPSSTLCTTGGAGSTDGTGVSIGAGRALAAGGERPGDDAGGGATGYALRDLHDGLLPRRSGVNTGNGPRRR